jgi:hypothetical protein
VWDEDGEDDSEVAELRRKARHAMDVLEEGKPVAAFNLLKRIVENDKQGVETSGPAYNQSRLGWRTVGKATP